MEVEVTSPKSKSSIVTSREKNNEKMRIYRTQHPEILRAIKRREYLKHAEQHKARSRRWYHSNRDRAKIASRRRALAVQGTTPEERDQRIKSQDGKCAICIRPFRSSRDIHTDHDHKTGQFRGLLCTTCNLGLGVIEKESKQWLTKAMRYLQMSKRAPVKYAKLRPCHCGMCGNEGHNSQTCKKRLMRETEQTQLTAKSS